MEFTNPPPQPFSTAVAQSPTVTASPYTYTNANNNRQQVIISGGTVLTISLVRSGSSTLAGLLAGTYTLNPGDALVITYVIAPTLTVLAL